MTLITKCFFELIGTMVLILLGDGVCANNTLNKSKGQNGGWIVITIAWGFAVLSGSLIAGPYSGAHLNPAVTLGFALAGQFEWAAVVPYIIAQMIGGFLGACLVFIYYKDHYDATEDTDAILGTFCTMPAIPNKWRNLFCEVFATWFLIFMILALTNKESMSEIGLGAIGSLPVPMIIMSIGMSLGGTTGYAMNPARDLGPRLAHAILPLKHKRESGWSYSWIPVAGPMIGGILATISYLLIF